MSKVVPSKESRRKIGLALGGGSVRSFAHIGVLQILESEKIPIDFISGTSSGSLIAAIYADKQDMRKFNLVSFKVNWRQFTALKLTRHGFISSLSIENFVKKIVPHDRFQDLAIPLAVTATDLVTSEGVILTDGSLSLAVRMSCSFPGVYIPVESALGMMADGGLVNNVPVEPLRALGADIVIGVDVIPTGVLSNRPHNIFSIADRAIDVMLKHQTRAKASLIDVLIEPVQECISSFDMKRKKDLISMGREATIRALPRIRELMG